MSLRIGIDVGGTKIEGIVLSGELEIARIRVNTPRDYQATIEAIGSLVELLEQRTESHAPSPEPRAERIPVGVGIPGAEAPATGLVKNANSVWLIGRPLRGIWSSVWVGPSASQTMRTALPCPKRQMALRRAPRWCSE